MEQKQETK